MPLPAVYCDKILAGEDPALFATRGCLRPRPLAVRDMFGLTKTIVTDCGKCIRCQDAARNEMATRMYLHSYSQDGYTSPWKYCYFVTLTYGSYDLNTYEKHPFLQDWLDTYPSLDRWNSTGHYSWCPSLLIIGHVQKYLKRLRKRAAQDDITISYCYCGEYGHTWGRCHWHLILWSTKELPFTYIKNAWGFDYVEQSDKCLVAPRDTSDPDSIKHFDIGDVKVEDLVNAGAFTQHITSELGGQSPKATSCFSYVAKYLHKGEEGMNEFTEFRMRRAYEQLPFYDDEFTTRILTYRNKVYNDLTYDKFKKIFRPLFSSSSAYSIGKGYYLANRNRFAKGDRSLPSFRGKELTFPKYYNFLLQNDKNPLYFERCTLKGVSFVRSDFEIARKYFKELSINPALSLLSQDYSTSSFDRANIAYPGQDTYCLNYVVFKTPEQGTVRAFLNVETLTFDFYKFSSNDRDYYMLYTMPVCNFCEYIIHIIDEAWKKDLDSLNVLNKQLSVFHFIEESGSAQAARERFIAERNKSQLSYYFNHQTF